MIATTTTQRSASSKANSSEPEVKRTFVVHHLNGIHARPAALLVNTLQNYRCRVLAECGGGAANPRSIFGLLTLAAGYGSKITFTAIGIDAAAAMDEVEKLFQSNFNL